MHTIIKQKLLVVEGESDKRFFEALLKNLSIDKIQILPIGGKTKLRENLKALAASNNFNTINVLAVIRDADDDHAGAFKSVCDAISGIGLTPPADQLVLTNSKPFIGIMILPKPDENGELEDVCINSLLNKPEMECIENYMNCVSQKTKRILPNLSKSKIYTYIAGSNEPELRLGEASEKGLFNWDDPAFDLVKSFLKLIADS